MNDGRTATTTASTANAAASGTSAGPHTRFTSGWPKIPDGFTSSTTRITSSATGSRRSAPTKSTYVPIRLRPDAEDQPAHDRADRRVDPAEHRGREGVDQERAAIRFGSRNRLGAASIPAIGAEHGGEPPAEREHPGHAHADEPGLRRVDRGGAHREPDLRVLEQEPEATTVASTTAIVPMSWIEIATPPISIVRVGNGLCTARTSPDQIRMTSPLIASSRPIVTITTRSTEPFSFGRMTPWWIADAADERGR